MESCLNKQNKQTILCYINENPVYIIEFNENSNKANKLYLFSLLHLYYTFKPPFIFGSTYIYYRNWQ